MRTVVATRYVTPLREGGSLPAVVEGDDEGLYVAKFRGAGQGVGALVSELLGGELARAAGLRVPELVRIEVGPELGRNEPDSEIRNLLKASVGTNLGLDYLPGSITYDPILKTPSAEEASAIVALDALLTNVDRTPRNSNLLTWHKQVWLIDHGAALYFHHGWDGREDRSRLAFPAIKDHVLLRWATGLPQAARALAEKLGKGAVAGAVAELPDAWLAGDPRFASPAEYRAAYAGHLERRLAWGGWVEEADRARAKLV